MQPQPKVASTKERIEAGKVLREKVPRSSHGEWAAPKNRPDPIAQILQSDRGRVPELLPIRYERMSQSPFAFFRGAANLMAADLAKTPTTGIRVQACGDCHLANFGGFASPERTLLFDINDFDETLPAPWEWDVKRLATSAVLAGKELGASKELCADAAQIVAQSYRTHMHAFARMRAMETWYSHIEASVLIKQAPTQGAAKYWKAEEQRARLQTAGHLLKKMTEVAKGWRRIVDNYPLVFHPRKYASFEREVRDIFDRYRLTLPVERRVVLDRYHFVDAAIKVVGVGSAGTRCGLVLLMAGEDDPLFLQFKEAQASVLEPYAGKSRYENHAERVATGQRMLQAASDVFLGWTRDRQERDFYFRQLRDMKMTIDITSMSVKDWQEFLRVCGWALARGHARTGDSAKISGYTGKGEIFDEAIREFALEYAAQVRRDYKEFLQALRDGRIKTSKKSKPSG